MRMSASDHVRFREIPLYYTRKLVLQLVLLRIILRINNWYGYNTIIHKCSIRDQWYSSRATELGISKNEF